MQHFKGDDLEKKMIAVGFPILEALSLNKDQFLEEAYAAAPLGDVIYFSNRAPLAKAIVQSIFRSTFKEIFEAFVVAGTFESYVTVFKKIFGEGVDVTFTVPAPGKLVIDIVASDLELSEFAARYISNNQYMFDNVVDHEGNQIVFSTIQGFQSQYELEQMLFELVPAGIFTTITLSFGS